MFTRLYNLFLRCYGYLVFGRRVVVFGWFTVVNRKNIRVGRNLAVNHGVFIAARDEIVIGDDVILSAGAKLIDAGLDADSYLAGTPRYPRSFIHIEDRVWVGAGAIILPGVTLGRNCIVGAGSVVAKDVPPYSIVAGNPARVLRRVEVPLDAA